jgi:indolepyruvate ferredoxin oxidoreductase alpha subunit
MERSFAQDVEQLGYGAGQVLTGEGILAITKAILQPGVSYVGGYPGAPVSHLLDVLAEANTPLLEPMGIHFEVSQGPEGEAAALDEARRRLDALGAGRRAVGPAAAAR